MRTTRSAGALAVRPLRNEYAPRTSSRVSPASRAAVSAFSFTFGRSRAPDSSVKRPPTNLTFVPRTLPPAQTRERTGVCVRAERSLSGSEKNKRGKYSSPKSKSDEVGMTTNAQDLREAEELRAQAVASVLSASESCSFDGVPSVSIDEGVVQKYVLMKANDPSAKDGVRYFVVGNKHADYHREAARPLVKELQKRNVAYDILGGGRIRHDPLEKSIFIYGFSYGFPWEDDECLHYLAWELCKEKFPDYHISWSPEGY